MIRKLFVQPLILWAGWSFATFLRDLWHHGNAYELEQVRARHDERREQAVAARLVRFPAAGYVLFAGECALTVVCLVARDTRTQRAATVGSLGCVLVTAVTYDLLLPQFNRSEERRLMTTRGYTRVTRMKNGPVPSVDLAA